MSERVGGVNKSWQKLSQYVIITSQIDQAFLILTTMLERYQQLCTGSLDYCIQVCVCVTYYLNTCTMRPKKTICNVEYHAVNILLMLSVSDYKPHQIMNQETKKLHADVPRGHH